MQTGRPTKKLTIIAREHGTTTRKYLLYGLNNPNMKPEAKQALLSVIRKNQKPPSI